MRVALMLFMMTAVAAQAQEAVIPAPMVTGTVETATKGNLPSGFYPKSPCAKPQKVTKDSTVRTSGGSAGTPMVNKEVEQFNRAAALFNICIKTYVDNARLDTQHILSVANAAAAQKVDIPFTPAVGGNMPTDFYPRSPCIQPVPPENPAAARDRESALRRGVRSLPDDPRAAAYNLHVKTFNTQVTTFNACIKTYMDNAQRDIQQIQSIVHAAVADGNAPLTDPKGDFMTERRR